MSQAKVVQRFPTVAKGSTHAPGDTFYKEEIQLALRNRGMPLEGLRYPITPTGMHYLLVHFDIPEVNLKEWRMKVGGLVSKPMSLTLEDLKARPAITLAVTMECAGNGLVERDLPFYPDISEETVTSLNRFAQSVGMLPGPVPYEQVLAVRFRDLWRS